MTKFLSRTAFGVGLFALAWVAAGYLHANALALFITLVIAGFYLAGALELRRFEQTTDGLARALGEATDTLSSLDTWLVRVPASLQNTVRLRIEGERVPLPGPALTPYLAGLLVLLGMLGTFTGMIITLAGTGAALQQATDLQTMRDSLAAPVKGLGLAFGASVAGVASSAMLGLMASLCRRERLHVAQRLDAQIATTLRRFSRTRQREESLGLQQRQADSIALLADRLHALMGQLDAHATASNEQLLERQERFQSRTEAAYRDLSSSIDRTLQRSLADSAQAAVAAIRPLAEATLNGIARETTELHRRLAETVGQQLDGMSSRFDTATSTVTATWHDALGHHTQTSDAMAHRWSASLDAFSAAFEQRSTRLVEKLAHEIATRDHDRLTTWSTAMTDMAATLKHEWQQAGLHNAGQHTQICTTLEQTAQRITGEAHEQASRTLAEIARLVDTASEAPRAAAEVVAQLREKLSDSMARDNAMLEERSRVMTTLNTLADAMQHTTTEQRAAVDKLVASTAAWLEQAGARFTEKIDAESARMDTVAAQLTSGAVDVASLGEAFAAAVDLFCQSSQQLMSHLQRVDDTLGKSIARSDEQLAYYVAQARELIELSIVSQKQVVDDLHRVAARRSTAHDATDKVA